MSGQQPAGAGRDLQPGGGGEEDVVLNSALVTDKTLAFPNVSARSGR